MKPRRIAARIWLCASVAALFASDALAQSPPLERIHLPPGFTIELLARVPGAREMAFGPRGTLFVGSNTGSVYAVSYDANGGRATVRTIASGLREPVGVAFRAGALYVSAVSRILRFPDIESHLDDPPQPVVVSDRFPTEGHHGWKFIAFGPDGKLYVPVGAPCNICEPDRDRYANIMRMNPDGSGLEVYARGIRNSVGFDWDPRTGALWFTNNGRDNMGDDVPPDTLNVAPKAGLDFGYPYCHAGTIPDPEFGRKRPCPDFARPAQLLGAHVASLGMRFYTGTQFPAAYRGQIFIAEHGSWNRSSKVGYRVTLVRLDANGKPVSYEPFAEGWLEGQRAFGRPADVAVAPDGSLLIADDTAGAVYRVRYRG
ncbi:MAG TPA: sorbosone dehydrogenase family protein [Casimicrobiaceae bacterium]|nr:sorbosone dehydrogenase family protein [Casimicrobiaceae bacterium]